MIKDFLRKIFKTYYKCPNNQCLHNKKNHYCELNGKCSYENRITGKKLK